MSKRAVTIRIDDAMTDEQFADLREAIFKVTERYSKDFWCGTTPIANPEVGQWSQRSRTADDELMALAEVAGVVPKAS